MIYVILATMCILIGGNQILNGFGLLKVNCVLLCLVLSNALSCRYHIRKLLRTYIYIYYDIFVTGGEHCISISVITQFLQREENITYFLQGEHMCTQRVIIKKGENVGTCFDEDFVKHFIWSSNTRRIKSSS